MANRSVLFFVTIIAMGFVYMSIAVHEVAWFYSFGWVIGLLGIASFVALFPVSSIIRLLGLIVQIFALFLPIKVYTTLNELQVYHLKSLESIDPVQILGQLFTIIGVLVTFAFLLYWFIRRKWDLETNHALD
ncbi:hypothetical protein [Brevibacillus sp. SYSU BS000544]|uniref:hypothetical protein n=1 Tax=Brevibacillus sp. SYSU BS000544 TaxID=3416443 RepID=UPI003CE58F2D